MTHVGLRDKGNNALIFNLLVTSRTETSVITDTGKERGILQRVRDWWNDRPESIHLIQLCQKLNGADKEFRQLDTKSQILIYSKIRQIADKLGDKVKDKQVGQAVKQLEDATFSNPENVKTVCGELFAECAKSHLKVKHQLDFRELRVVIEHYKEDQCLLHILGELWKHSKPTPNYGVCTASIIRRIRGERNCFDSKRKPHAGDA